MTYLRRWTVLLGLGITGVVLALFADRSAGQLARPPVQPKGTSGGSAAGLSSVKIIEDSQFRRVINVGRDCVKDKDWNQAVQALQSVLNQEKDYYVQVHETDPTDPKKDIARWTSVKFEANNLIGSMPLEGLDTYEQAHGAEAKTMLDEAKKKGDRDELGVVAQRFCHTKAGIEAKLQWLDDLNGRAIVRPYDGAKTYVVIQPIATGSADAP